jgi:cysteine desulfurase
VDAAGRVDLAALEAAIREETTLVSVMAANNEVGTVQDCAAIGALCRANRVPFHVDAVQAAGWLSVTAADLGADAVSISGHKLGALKGSGALFARGRLVLEPLLHGGGQERGRRSGTENVAAAVGLGVAATLAAAERDEASARVSLLRDELIAGVLAAVPSAVLTGDPVNRLPSIASFLFPGTSGESVLLGLEEHGVVASSGSACAAGSDEPSHVLVALGVSPTLAQTAVRFSLTQTTTAADVAEAVAAARRAVEAAQSLGRRP